MKQVIDDPQPGDPKLPRRTGTVLWFSVERGVGFLQDNYSGTEVFVGRRSVKRHYLPQARHNLYVGDQIEYTPMRSMQGLFAAGVTLLDKPLSPAEDPGSAGCVRCLQETPDGRMQFKEKPQPEPAPLIPDLSPPPTLRVGQINNSVLTFNPKVQPYIRPPYLLPWKQLFQLFPSPCSQKFFHLLHRLWIPGCSVSMLLFQDCPLNQYPEPPVGASGAPLQMLLCATTRGRNIL